MELDLWVFSSAMGRQIFFFSARVTGVELFQSVCSLFLLILIPKILALHTMKQNNFEVPCANTCFDRGAIWRKKMHVIQCGT